LKAEEGEQKEVFDFINLTPEIKHLSFATMNEVKVRPQEGEVLKALGKRRGVLDIYVDKPKHGYHGLRIELKAKSPYTGNWGYPTKEQKAWVEALNNEGYYAKVCKGATDAIQTIKDYLQGTLNENKDANPTRLGVFAKCVSGS
jgi:hypothetical protein